MSGHWQTWPFIGVDELRQINPDCVGWIHMDASPIDYPVVKQRFDRGYYLTHNFSGEESVHGQVVMDFMHGGRMSDRATVLHAHHMKDWSMFKAIVSLEDPGYLAAHPTIGLVHEGTRYDARWFAGVCYLSSDPWPERTRFAEDALPLEARAAAAHFALGAIHPFRDGNGHCARMLMCSMLSPAYPLSTLLALDANIQKSRTEIEVSFRSTMGKHQDAEDMCAFLLTLLLDAQTHCKPN